MQQPKYFNIIQLSVIGVLVVLGLFLLMLTLNEVTDFSRGNLPYSNSITVQGTGKATVIPDLARITFSVTEAGATVDAAQTAATTKTDAALAAIKKEGIDDKDVKTVNYSVSPQYDYTQNCSPNGICQTRAPKIIGYEVSQSVEVKVRDTSKAGTVLQDLGTVGVQNVSGPNFGMDDPDGAATAARADAIKDAQEKAKVLAEQLGVRLGKVISYSEGGYYPEAGYGGDMGTMSVKAASVAPTLPVGENTQTQTVMVTYEIN